MNGNIQPLPQQPSNSLKIPQNARELVNYYRQAPHKGAQIEMFLAFAQTYPHIAIPAFCEILQTNADFPMRALAIQSFATVAKYYPQLTQDMEVLRYLANEAKGQGIVTSDLTRWAGAWAVEAVGFSHDAIEHLQGGAMTEKPYRIRDEIISRKLEEIERIKRFDLRGQPTAEYERFLEFYIYGTEITQELFKANISTNKYEDIIADVIYQLNIRGVELALDNQNDSKPQIAMTAFSVAGRLFLESSNEDEQKRLITAISRFLNNDFNSNIPLRKKVAEAIINAGNCLHSYLRARALVICERWNDVVNIGEVAVKPLDDILERNLLLDTKENKIIEQQTKAIKAIDNIAFQQLNDKVNLLSKVLLFEQDILRETSAKLLVTYQQKLDQDLINLVTCILFTYNIQKFELKNANIKQMEQSILSTQQDKLNIENIFNLALSYTLILASKHQKKSDFLKNFLLNKKNKYTTDIDSWNQELNQQIKETSYLQGIINHNQLTLNTTFDNTKYIDQELPQKVGILPSANVGQLTYNECQQYLQSLKEFQNQFNQKINSTISELDKFKNKRKKEFTLAFYIGTVLIISMILLLLLPLGFYWTVCGILGIILLSYNFVMKELNGDNIGCFFISIFIIPWILKSLFL